MSQFVRKNAPKVPLHRPLFQNFLKHRSDASTIRFKRTAVIQFS